MGLTVKVSMLPIKSMMGSRQLLEKQKVQIFIDNEVMRLSHPYIPFDTGMLARSSISSTNVGSGVVNWETPYARRQYYEHGEKKLWFERMKAQHKAQIVQGAARIAGGKGE